LCLALVLMNQYMNKIDIPIYIKQDAKLHDLLYLEIALYVLGGNAAIAASSSNGVTNTRCCRYSCCRS
jgi:hypothetical protein